MSGARTRGTTRCGRSKTSTVGPNSIYGAAGRIATAMGANPTVSVAWTLVSLEALISHFAPASGLDASPQQLHPGTCDIGQTAGTLGASSGQGVAALPRPVWERTTMNAIKSRAAKLKHMNYTAAFFVRMS